MADEDDPDRRETSQRVTKEKRPAPAFRTGARDPNPAGEGQAGQVVRDD